MSYQTLTRRDEYEQIRAALWAERDTFRQHWRDLADHILPRRQRFTLTDRNRGERRNLKILDSTATFSARTLSAGMHGGMTNPARPWMRLTTPDPDLAEFGPVKEWLHLVTQRMRTVFLKSNIYDTLPLAYRDLGVFGTAAFGIMGDHRSLLRSHSYPIGSYAVGMDAAGRPVSFVREFVMTVRQIVREFVRQPDRTERWDRVSVTVRNLWDQGKYEAEVQVCWLVTANEDEDASKIGSRYMPWRSVHFEKGQNKEDKFLRDSGFRQFPVMVMRWDVTGEDTYATDCPGMTALGDIRQLQTMQKRKAQAVEKIVNPPLQAPTALSTKGVGILPGYTNYVDVREGMAGLRPVHEVRADIAALTADIQDTRFQIRRAFYEDVFLMLASRDTDAPDMTATEIVERKEEKLIALGPVVERTEDEGLGPLVDRTYAMMEEAGMIPPVPDELDGVDLKVEYISLMAQAQKLVGIGGSERFVQNVIGMSEFFPEVRHKFNAMQAVDDFGDMLGVNPKWIVSDEDAMAALEAEQQAIEAQMQAEQAANLSKSAQALGNTPMGQGSALDEIVESGA